MSDISNADIYNVLLRVSGDIGELKGNFAGTAKQVTQNCEDIQQLQIKAASQRGSTRVWNLVGNACVGILSAVAAYFGTKGH